MYRNILLALDLNESSDHDEAIDAALHLMDAATDLHILTVVPNFGMPLVGQFFPAGYEKNLVTHTETALAKLVDGKIRPKTARPVIQAVSQGVIYEEVLTYAKDRAVDLIIINSQKPELKDYLLGPNAARVVRHADCSVMVVRR